MEWASGEWIARKEEQKHFSEILFLFNHFVVQFLWAVIRQFPFFSYFCSTSHNCVCVRSRYYCPEFLFSFHFSGIRNSKSRKSSTQTIKWKTAKKKSKILNDGAINSGHVALIRLLVCHLVISNINAAARLSRLNAAETNLGILWRLVSCSKSTVFAICIDHKGLI